MGERREIPYGEWSSPITAASIAAGTLRLGAPSVDGSDVYWLEGRPAEGGRNVLVRRGVDGGTVDVTPPPYDARTRVHEYGGGAYVVARGTLWFVHFADQRIYRQRPGTAPHALTPEGSWRFADLAIDGDRARLVAVGEDHARPGVEPAGAIVAVDGNTGEVKVLARGHDFYASPAGSRRRGEARADRGAVLAVRRGARVGASCRVRRRRTGPVAGGRHPGPVVFFQGLHDRVVPPEQAERMVGVLRARGLPVAYLAFRPRIGCQAWLVGLFGFSSKNQRVPAAETEPS